MIFERIYETVTKSGEKNVQIQRLTPLDMLQAVGCLEAFCRTLSSLDMTR